MKTSKVKRALKNGSPVAMAQVERIFSPRLIEMLGMLGWRCLWTDMEHSDLSYETLSHMACAARAGGIEIILRIAKGGYSNVLRPLELGVTGLVLPHCKSAGEARELVQMAKFPPLGMRGIGHGVDCQYGLTDYGEFMVKANQETILIPQIEDKEGVAAIDEILEVEGIDGVFIGPCDLSKSLGVVNQTEHPKVREAIDTIAQACQKHGKWWGSPAQPGEKMRELLKKGASLLACAQDATLFLRAFRNALELTRAEFLSSSD